MYSAAVGWTVLFLSVQSIWSNIQLRFSTSLLIFFVDDLFIVESWVLKIPTLFFLIN